MNMLLPKHNPIRNRKYLDWIRQQPCVISGLRGNHFETVDPAHIGTLGKGIKSGDDEVLPLRHSYHVEGHQSGEISMFRKYAPDELIRDALRAYAREQYREWKNG